MAKNLKISIFAYLFPPDQGVGGRRWGIFAKELAALGHNIIITTTNADIKEQYWLRTSENPVIRFRNLKTPIFPRSYGSSIPRKILWHFTKYYYQLIYHGWFHDPTISLKSQIEKFIENDVSQETDVIIVSCAPFRWAAYAGEAISLHHGKAKLFIDLRDPWTRNHLTYFTSLSPSRVAAERKIEQKAIELANGVIVTHSAMMSHYPNAPTTFIPNNIQSPVGQWSRKPIENELEFIFPGTLYTEGESDLIDFLEKCTQSFPNLKIKLTTIGSWDGAILQSLEKVCNVKHLGYVKHSAVSKLIQKHHYTITYVSPKLTYAINTKIIESIENKVPIIFLGKNDFEDFIETNNIGWEFNNLMSIDELSRKIYDDELFGPFIQEEFSNSGATNRLIDFIRNPRNLITS